MPLVQKLLTSRHHAGTFSNIKEHAPVAQLVKATDTVRKEFSIDTVISIRGGSPIDSAKAISHRRQAKSNQHLYLWLSTAIRSLDYAVDLLYHLHSIG